MITDIEAKDVKRLLLRVYRKYQGGSITEAQAYKETYLLNSVLKAIEVTDQEERLKHIEQLLKATNEPSPKTVALSFSFLSFTSLNFSLS